MTPAMHMVGRSSELCGGCKRSPLGRPAANDDAKCQMPILRSMKPEQRYVSAGVSSRYHQHQHHQLLRIVILCHRIVP
ncbi:hypothetical protein E4U13_008047 [Claviceps humidiphila]|uniref:Uncharacterized protein n=1 Tax=Claviceps humidiphila TaxID=1294629 RepID=A0A9P7Q545_9HYPO|nr:hypothetical protein E4U13_008047 [Claviceps humidiphila]